MQQQEQIIKLKQTWNSIINPPARIAEERFNVPIWKSSDMPKVIQEIHV